MKVGDDVRIIPPQQEVKPASILGTAVKVVLIAGIVGAVAGVIFYTLNSPVIPPKVVLDDYEQRDLSDLMKQPCREAVERYCKEGLDGKDVCLKDYLEPGWEPPFIKVEYNKDVLYPVYVQSDNCSLLVGQPTQTQRANMDTVKLPFVFIENRESIPVRINDTFPDRIKQFFAQRKDWNPEEQTINLKSHIHCRNISVNA